MLFQVTGFANPVSGCPEQFEGNFGIGSSGRAESDLSDSAKQLKKRPNSAFGESKRGLAAAKRDIQLLTTVPS